MDSAILLLNNMGISLVAVMPTLSVEWALWSALVLWLVYVFIHHSPFLRHLAWVMVLVKPITTLLVESPISLYAPLSAILNGLVMFFFNTPKPAFVSVPAPLPTAPISATNTALAATTTSSLDFYGYLALAWFAGAAFLSLRLVLGYAYVRYLRHGSTPILSGHLHHLLQQTETQLGMRRRVRLGLSDAVPSPLLTGVLRPLILLPTSLKNQLGDEQLRLIFAHELTHVRRYDNLILLGQRLVELMLFFHPATWICNYHLRREAERACDDAVLRHFPNSARYADSLARVAELRNDGVPRLLISTFAAAETQLRQRVQRILTRKPQRKNLLLSSATAALLLAAGCVGLPAFLSGPKKAALMPQEGITVVHAGRTQTAIEFDLPKKQHVQLEIFDQRGMRVATLLSEERERGHHVLYWNGQDARGQDAPEGIYFGRFKTEGSLEVRKILLEYGDLTLDPQLQQRSGPPRNSYDTVPPQTAYLVRGKVDTFLFDPADSTTEKLDANDTLSVHMQMDNPDTLLVSFKNPSITPSTFDTLIVEKSKIDSGNLVFVRSTPADSIVISFDRTSTPISGPWSGQLVALKNNGRIDTLNVHMALKDAANDSLVFIIDSPVNNGSTTEQSVTFAVPKKSKVKLFILSHMGVNVRTLIDDAMSKGIYTVNWDSMDDMGNKVPPGVYFYQLKIGDEFKRIGKRIVQ